MSLFDKLTNFLMPLDEEYIPESETPFDRRPHLKVHSPVALKLNVIKATCFDDVKNCADCLKSGVAVLVNFEEVNMATKIRILDFLDGVNFVIDSSSQQVSDSVVIYAPANVDINKELYAYSVPAYAKRRREG